MSGDRLTLAKLIRVKEKLDNDFYGSFMGVKVVLDTKLPSNAYEIRVGPGLWDGIQDFARRHAR